MMAAGTFEQALGIGAIGLLCLLGAVAACLVVVVFHELAHALVGFLLGFRILEIQVGGGMPWHVVSCFGVRISLHRRPWAGLVRWQPRGKYLLRMRFLAAVLAGPLANIAVAVAATPLVVAVLRDAPKGLYYTQWYGGAFGFMAFAWAFAGLVPVVIRGAPKTDMAIALSTLNTAKAAIPGWLEASRAQALAHDFYEALQCADYSGAEALLAEGERRLPASGDWCKGRALLCLLTGDLDGALAVYGQGETMTLAELHRLERECVSSGQRLRIRLLRAQVKELDAVNNAFFLAQTGRQEDLVKAERRCADQNKKSFGGEACAARLRTHGMILLRLGRVDEGLVKLQQSFRLPEPFWLRAMCAGYLAYGHALRGDRRATRRFLRKARRLGPRSPLVDIAERWTEAALAPQAHKD